MRQVLVPTLVTLVFLCSGCASRRGSEAEKAPEGSPEALMDMLGGGRPKPRPNPAELAKHPLGSQQNPVRVGGPAGERAYLARLRLADIPAFVTSRGDVTAGAVIVKLNTLDGRATAYVCERFVCQRPVTNPDELAAQL